MSGVDVLGAIALAAFDAEQKANAHEDRGQKVAASVARLQATELAEARAGMAEVIVALELSQEWIKQAVIDGCRQPSTATLFRNQNALAGCKGAQA